MSRLGVRLGVACYGAAVLAPMAYLILRSFLDPAGRFTVVHYGVYLSPLLGRLLWRSLLLAGGTALATALLGVPAGILLSRTRLLLRPLLWVLLTLPLVLPPYMMTLCWFYLLAPEGWLNKRLLAPLGLGPILFPALEGFPGAIFSMTLSYLPFLVLLTALGVRLVAPAREEAARLTVGPWRAFIQTTLPESAPFLLTGTVFVFFFALMNYAVPFQFSLGGTFVAEIHSQYQTYHAHGRAAALTVPFFFTAAALFAGERRCLRRVLVHGGSRLPPPSLPLGPAGPLAWLFLGLLGALATVGPVGVLVWLGHGGDRFRRALAECGPEYRTSLLLALVAAAVAVLLGLAVAARARRPDRTGRLLDVAGLLPLAVPPMSLGVALILLWNRTTLLGHPLSWVARLSDWVYASPVIMVLALLGRVFPFAMRPVLYALRRLPPHWEEAARLHGAGEARTFLGVTLPLLARPLALGWFLSFALALGDYDALHLVQQPGYPALGPRIVGAFHNFRHDLVGPLGLLLLGTVLCPLALYVLWPRRRTS